MELANIFLHEIIRDVEFDEFSSLRQKEAIEMNKKTRKWELAGWAVCVLLIAAVFSVNTIYCFFEWEKIPLSIPTVNTADDKMVVLESYGKLPLSFIENKGQVNKEVSYYLNGSQGTIYFTREAIVFDLLSVKAPASEETNPTDFERLSFTLEPVGARKDVKLTARHKLPGKANYFIGNDPKNWHTDIPIYREVIYKDLYRGIDLNIYGTNNQMKYDFVVYPGAEPKDIKMAFEGINALSVDKEGNLVIRTAFCDLMHLEPFIYQNIDGKHQIIKGSFVVAENTFGFDVRDYDRNYPLIIDPLTLFYSTYLGGSSSDQGVGIAVDASGNAYVTGQTTSTNFPTDSAIQGYRGLNDAFITKLSASGNSLVYSTYLGGSGSDGAGGIAVDASGNAYVTGRTTSTDFPVQSAYQGTYGGGPYDAFVTKLSASGNSLVYSTYLGGNVEERCLGIAVDTSENTYVTGYTTGDFPTENAYQGSFRGDRDAFVTKLSALGNSLVYSTYLGGSGRDAAFDIAVDASGNAYVTGRTWSANFPRENTIQGYKEEGDAFVTKLSASGNNLVYSTHLGGSGHDAGRGITVDASGNAYVTGYTSSMDFPTRDAYQGIYGELGDVFVTKLSGSDNSLVYSTYLGGSGGDDAFGIAVDASGNAYVTGDTTGDFPIKDAYQSTYEGNHDAFVTKLSASGNNLVYSTYLGGSGYERGWSIAVDASGNAYVTGDTEGSFPTESAYQSTYGGGEIDAFVTKFAVYGVSEMIDQSCTQSDGINEIVVNEPKGQEFKPCLSLLVGVDIWLETLNPGASNSDTVTIEIHENSINGTIIASTSDVVSSGWNGFYYFDLPDVLVTPDDIYVIEVDATNELFGWASNTDNYYSNGRGISNGTPYDNLDHAFRTYTLVPSVWEYIVAEHRKEESGDMVVGDYFALPFPPCCTGPKEIEIDASYSSMLMDMEDFDNDGDFDYLVMKVSIGVTGPQAWFLLYTNTGDLAFTETVVAGPITLPSNLWEAGNIGLTAADFDDDGWPDFAATIPKSGENVNEIHFYENDGSSSVTFTHLAAQTIVADWAVHARDMDAGDFDQDGDYDFVIFDYPHGASGNFKIYWYESTGGWSFTPHPIVDSANDPITTPNSVAMIVAGDFDSDGWLDFIVGQDDDGDPGQAWIYFNIPDDPPGDFEGPYEAYDLELLIESGSDQPGYGLADALDCDGDGNLDIIATGGKDDPLRPILYFVRGIGDGTFYDPVMKYGGNLDGAGPAVAAPPVWFYTKPPEAKIITPGIFSSFNLYHDEVELFIRVNKEAYSNKIYGIEIFRDAQQPTWDNIEVLEVPKGWSFRKIGNRVRFYTETNPLLSCQGVKFTFRVKAERISWYLRIHVTDQAHQNIGMIVTMRWLYHFYLV